MFHLMNFLMYPQSLSLKGLGRVVYYSSQQAQREFFKTGTCKSYWKMITTDILY